MIKVSSDSQADFYKRFLMGRGNYSPLEFGVDLTRDAFMDLMVEEFNVGFRVNISIDELVLRPQLAMKFCQEVRNKHGFYDVPDDIILRSIMNRRKGGGN